MNIKNQIKDILKKNIFELEDVEISDELELISKGYLESFDIINIISILEIKFNINMPIEEIEMIDFNTVNNIYCLIERIKALE
ncbi:acyl carrier protein [Clostridium botulinum]|uniref:Acyl carrier protein n=4 Tax=Clostridium botulinum TaxID=1491 RepID=A5I520_CLOBH|nr:acyl carrier protein [Clostridium botulinum]EKN41794.1 D-alanyl carrier protein-like protein [Clostridium botulinum CFSAN001627]EPS47796.1 D-alanyl carrier protein-like protein [Clostridium botulinum CFSAN002369]EPS51077.1 D-alanyl carrier protein-like protein [Clostridium botulinum CFSAN002367]ABS33075.1 D-alanine--poly(phosphoribitol) ligase subunit 2, homolog [Clostridium botulinum A str. ATCC 19397]ABS39043.1 D-alanine--poly(phosphoribitol) ligase subunit 2, homolog [Clostridium botulin